MKNEISRIASTSQLGGVNILDSTFSSAFLVEANAADIINVNVERAGSYSASGLFVTNTSVLTESEASAAMASISEAISIIDAQRTDLGAVQNRFQSTIRNISHISENVSAARSCIRDTDFAVETAALTRWQVHSPSQHDWVRASKLVFTSCFAVTGLVNSCAENQGYNIKRVGNERPPGAMP